MEKQKPKFKFKFNFTAQMLLATVLGIAAGLIFKEKVASVKFIGDLFLRLVSMCVVPLIMGQIIEAVGTPDPKDLGRVGGKAIAVFAISSLLAALFGALFAVIFKPGAGIVVPASAELSIEVPDTDIVQTLIGFIPSNVVDAMAKGVIIQIISFSLFFGVALAAYPKKEKKQAFLDSLGTFNDIIMKIINYVMAVAPIGIGVLLASTIGQMGAQVILPLIKYLGVLALGVVIFMILWLIVVTVKTKLNVFQLIKKLTPVSILAIVTTSSAVCLPVAMKDTREKIGVSDYVTNLVLPMGMPLNSNGAAMHMALTVITIAQIYGAAAHYTVGHYFYIALMATLLSLANAVAPGADLVSLAIIVPQLGLPIESIAIFAGVGWFVGALRTILNVDSDIFSAILVADSENEIDRELFKLTSENPDYVRPEAAE